MSPITVTGKVLGRSKPLFTNWRVPIPPSIGAGGDRLIETQLGLCLTNIYRQVLNLNERSPNYADHAQPLD
ncbi:hypothetical protein [Aliterella atlantica]|uniref:hypothetical protein n=1 Tax=Aliterella atlantica TaxID=1827278 RepID=UPI001186812E|nr:hypothetical protein [Aliterella atlantica]